LDIGRHFARKRARRSWFLQELEHPEEQGSDRVAVRSGRPDLPSFVQFSLDLGNHSFLRRFGGLYYNTTVGYYTLR